MRVQVAWAVSLATTTLISAAATTPTADAAAPVLLQVVPPQQQQQQQQQQNPVVDPSVRAHQRPPLHSADQDQDQDHRWMAPVVVEAGAQGGRSMGAVVLVVVGAAGVFAMGLV
ncbi:unnamed protein product [Clonostachys chloroleuca]|uniref:Uncharacterized protein n=1 Tax=Clonostachys chloroleuca TaxID=1926264 RepID=A0AA35MII8_9HYPO|nr:unnamed protein product [Clonostachys chloroleuca]